MIPDSLVNYLTIRLEQFEILSNHVVVPGCMDTNEHLQLQGRIKELKRVLDFVGDLMIKDLQNKTQCDYNALLEANK